MMKNIIALFLVFQCSLFCCELDKLIVSHNIGENPELVQELIAKGANPDSLNCFKQTPLILAAQEGQIATMRILLDHGVDINAIDEAGMTALSSAAEGNHPYALLLLLERGAVIQDLAPGYNPLVQAILSGNQESIDLLLQKGADINAHSRWHTPLTAAISVKNIALAHKLLDLGASIDYNEETTGKPALFFAAEYGTPTLVEKMIEKGAYIDYKDQYNMTALHEAVNSNNVPVIRKLVEFGARTDFSDDENTESLLSLAVSRYDANIDVVEYLIEQGANIDLALHYAAQKGFFSAVKLLVDNGADVNKVDSYGRSPLHYAAESWSDEIEIERYLIEKGAQLNIKDRSEDTPVVVAAYRKKWDLVHYLLMLSSE